MLASGKDELYTYDDLDRLVDMQRGNLDGSKLFVSGASFSQTWTLDSLGNWTGLNDNGTTQTRTHDAANKLTGITDSRGWVAPAYDAAGNMTKMPAPTDETKPLHAKYDAWGRMVEVRADDPQNPGQPGDLVARYEYDGLNRRIEKETGGNTYDYYFNESWQVVETYLNVNSADLSGAKPLERFVWDLRHIDTPVVRFYDANMDGDFADGGSEAQGGQWVVGDSILFYLDDANHNITAVFDANPDSPTAGNVVERYLYASYGKVQILNGAADKDNAADLTADADGVSDVANGNTYTGAFRDPETGLIILRHRNLHPTMGRFTRPDPGGYRDGANLHEYAQSSPVIARDPYGLQTTRPASPYRAPTLQGMGIDWSTHRAYGWGLPRDAREDYTMWRNNRTGDTIRLNVAVGSYAMRRLEGGQDHYNAHARYTTVTNAYKEDAASYVAAIGFAKWQNQWRVTDSPEIKATHISLGTLSSRPRWERATIAFAGEQVGNRIKHADSEHQIILTRHNLGLERAVVFLDTKSKTIIGCAYFGWAKPMQGFPPYSANINEAFSGGAAEGLRWPSTPHFGPLAQELEDSLRSADGGKYANYRQASTLAWRNGSMLEMFGGLKPGRDQYDTYNKLLRSRRAIPTMRGPGAPPVLLPSAAPPAPVKQLPGDVP